MGTRRSRQTEGVWSQCDPVFTLCARVRGPDQERLHSVATTVTLGGATASHCRVATAYGGLGSHWMTSQGSQLVGKTAACTGDGPAAPVPRGRARGEAIGAWRANRGTAGRQASVRVIAPN